MAKSNVEVVEKNEVIAKVSEDVTIERGEKSYLVNGVQMSVNATERDRKLFAKAMDEVNNAMTGVTKSTIRLAKAFYNIEVKKIYSHAVNAQGKNYRTTAALVKDRYNLGQTLVNNCISMYDKFFANADDKEKGIQINGHYAIEFGQTALIEMLPVMGNETEKEAVFGEVVPTMKVAEIKEAVAKNHTKNERKVKASTKTEASKELDFVATMEAVLNIVLNVNTDDFEEAEKAAIEKLAVVATGAYRSVTPEDAQLYFEARG